MSVLTKQEILRSLESGRLVITPLLSPKQIGLASVDLRIGTTALLARASDLSHIDPKTIAEYQKKPFESEQRARRKLERVSIPFHSQLTLHTGGVVLVSTYEWIRLPADLAGVVTARSSWAREGLSIATATFINPCYSGIITLELSNLGQVPIVLYPGLRVAQIALHSMDAATAGACPERAGQFDGSFEPAAGNLTDGDLPFIPMSHTAARGEAS
jgi:dCTP deaminase